MMVGRLFRFMWNAVFRRNAISNRLPMAEADAAELALAAEDFAAGRLAPARARYELLSKRHPGNAEILFRLGVIYGGSGLLAAAEATLERAAQVDPQSADILNARANVAWLQAAWEDAGRHFRAALELEPRNAIVWANFGLCLHDAGKLQEASAAVARALEIDPAHPDALVNAALVRLDLADTDGSRAFLQRALLAAPEFPEAHALNAQLLLRDERYAEGWREYEWRLRCAEARDREQAALPRWDGAGDHSRGLMVYAEQGLGDQIMFASCLPDVMMKVARCDVECDARLAALFSRSFPGIVFHPQAADLARPWAEARPNEASQIHLGSLPQLFRGDGHCFPRHHGYLKPDSAKAAYWTDQLASLGEGLKVGIAWRGGVPRTRQSMRSIPLPEWLPLLQCRGIHFVSLQHGRCEAELAEIRLTENVRIAHWRRAADDCDELAALIAGLDIVITVCGTVVHLAGALGRPAWVFVPACPEWRYRGAGDTMPWYPSVRLFRQDVLGDWRGPIRNVSQQLSAMAPPCR